MRWCAPVSRNAVSARKKTLAYEDEMPADGTIAARSPSEDFGTSRFEGRLWSTIPHVPVSKEEGR
jgi:hypothetical protein